MSDADIGGFSTANLKFIPATATEPAHARFNGCISTKLPVDRPQVHRTGYAAFRSQDRLATIFGRSFWDIDPYAYLALRVKSDGRKYHINVQSETIVPTDIHQHRLYVRQPGKWETVFLRWNDFVRTNHGAVVEPQNELLRQKIRTIGIGLIDRVPGPFDISVSRIWATNVPGETPGSALEHGERFESKPQGNSASAVNAMACNQ
jgi:NADH dehydrogenase [ubiquinone] 1 alpha subcomplex assembly factor 1